MLFVVVEHNVMGLFQCFRHREPCLDTWDTKKNRKLFSTSKLVQNQSPDLRPIENIWQGPKAEHQQQFQTLRVK